MDIVFIMFLHTLNPCIHYLNQVFTYGIKPRLNTKRLQLDQQQVSCNSDNGKASVESEEEAGIDLLPNELKVDDQEEVTVAHGSF